MDEGKSVELTLVKEQPTSGDGWWKSLVEGDPEIDLDLIEGSKYLDDSLLRKLKVCDGFIQLCSVTSVMNRC